MAQILTRRVGGSQSQTYLNKHQHAGRETSGIYIHHIGATWTVTRPTDTNTEAHRFYEDRKRDTASGRQGPKVSIGREKVQKAQIPR
jgi:hypothetical protein